ncbi:MAG: helix-turn-helix transcriptional regulator [Bacteroidales bacterium]|nr:helix-turn-helix transcriptional regulator [Bacteroidales bacterium]
MRTDIHIGIFDLFIFLGVFQGILLSWYFIKNGKNSKKANLYQGLLLLSLALMIFELLLNNTGYIVKLLPITNYAEPLNFVVVPLFYFYVCYSLDFNDRQKLWPHFVLSAFWLVYMFLFVYFQPDEVKYNSYIHTNHPDWPYLDFPEVVDDDPLQIRHFTNQITAVQFVLYMGASIIVLLRKFKSLNQSIFKTSNEMLIVLRNTTLHFLAIIAIFLATKSYYGIESDIGDYWIASYISLMIFTTSCQVMNKSDFFNKPHSFLDFPLPKYQKSSLSENAKESILVKIKKEMEANKYFVNNLASLSGLSKQINETSHHVSQVINEQLNMNFFELLAKYRVEEAKRILLADKNKKITIEELSEIVGYNSKSAFNNVFKKLTLQTPSEFRENPQLD